MGVIYHEVERLVKLHLQPGFEKQYFGLGQLAEAKRKATMIHESQVAGPSNTMTFVMSNLLRITPSPHETSKMGSHHSALSRSLAGGARLLYFTFFISGADVDDAIFIPEI